MGVKALKVSGQILERNSPPNLKALTNENRLRLYDFSDCQKLDELSRKAGFSEIQLMGLAALSSLYALERTEKDKSTVAKQNNLDFNKIRRILILCGPGNNGGDGLALAYFLVSRRRLLPTPALQVFLCSGPPKKEAPRFYVQHLQKLQVPLHSADDFLHTSLDSRDLVIEALLGSGQKQAPRGAIANVLTYIYTLRCSSTTTDYPYLISLDVPAGLSEENPAVYMQKTLPEWPAEFPHTGSPMPMMEEKTRLPQAWELPSVPSGQVGDRKSGVSRQEIADMMTMGTPSAKSGSSIDIAEKETHSPYLLAAPDDIHCYGAAKLALYLSSSLRAYSRIHLLPMGFYPASEPKSTPIYSHVYSSIPNPNKYRPFYKEPTQHKYKSGHGLLVGGSRGMEGAVIMAAKAFFAAGGGILHVLVPDKNSCSLLTTALPTVMFHDSESFPRGLQPHCLLLGPGLKSSDFPKVKPCLETWLNQPSITDQSYFLLDAAATALIFESNFAFPKDRTILLPHTGEWKALGGPAIQDTSSLYAAKDFFYKELKCNVLIKDAVSILFSLDVCQGEVETTVYSRLNPALSVAGTGDTLAGMLLALFAKQAVVQKQSCQEWRPNSIISAQTSTAQHASKDGFSTVTQDFSTTKKLIADRIFAALDLLHFAVRERLHPRSDEFSVSIEQALMELQ